MRGGGPGRAAPGRLRRGLVLLLAWAVAAAGAVAGPAAWPARASTAFGLRGSAVLRNPSGELGPPGQLTLGFFGFDGQLVTYLRYQFGPSVELGLASAYGARPGLGPLAVVRWQNEGPGRPALAAGVQYREGFVVAARSLEDGWTRAYGGLRLELAGNGSSVRPFAGLQRVLNPVVVRRPGQSPPPIVTAGVELDGQHLAVAVTLQVGSGLQLDLGLQSREWLQLGGGLSVSRQW